MAERNLNTTLKKRLINNEPFVYAHLIKYERPSETLVSGKHSTDAKRYAYLTDAAVNIAFDDGSYATDGTTANGSQTYIADKIAKIGAYSETSQAKATGMTLDLGAESLNNSVTASMVVAVSPNTITASTIDFVAEGFREGDKISITSGSNDGNEFKITGIKTNNTVLNIDNIDSTLVAQGATSITLKIVSDELKGPLLEMNDDTLKSYHNRDVFIYKVFLDPDDYTIIGAPNLVFKGIISSASLTEDPSTAMRVKWKLTSHWGDFSVVNGRWTNDAVHRALDNEGVPQKELTLKEVYANDLGFQHAETTLHILATYKAIEQETRYRKKSSSFFQKISLGFFGGGGLEAYEVDVEVEKDVDLNWALSSKYIPIVYGIDRVSGIPIFVDTKSNDTNNIYIVYALAEGEIGGIYDLYVENEPLVCSNLEDYDDRNVSGVDTSGATNSAEDTDVVCRGRADKGETIGGENMTGTSTNINWATEGLAGSTTGFLRSAEVNINSVHFYQLEDMEIDDWTPLGLVPTQVETDGSGVIHGRSFVIDKPNNVRFTLHSGKTDQAADNTLVTIAQGVKFKRQSDYYTDVGKTYWGPNHTLSDTAYVVIDCEITEDAETVPEIEYVIRGKYVDSFNYDFSYLHDPTVTITGAEAATHFSVGDTVDLKNSGGTVINDDVIIIDKWTMYGPDGLETRFRFSDVPELGYSNGVPSVTSFYMENSGSKTWHMVTYNHGQNSGTVPSALTTSGTTSIPGGVPTITITDPGWVDIFPNYKNSSNQLPIAFTNNANTHYQNVSFPVTHSSSATVLTMTGAASTSGFTVGSGENIIRTDAIKLAAGANSDDDDYYNGMTITLTIKQDSTGNTTTHTRKIIDYDEGTQIAQVDILWDEGKEPGRESGYTYTYEINTITDRRVSINPAMQLLDYMTSQTYGKRLDLNKDISLVDWLFAARTCDSRGTQTLNLTAGTAAAIGDRFVLTSDGSASGSVVAMGRVQAAITTSSTSVIMEECFGKFSKIFMKNNHVYNIGDIIQTSTGYYRVGGAASTLSDKPVHTSGVVTVGSTTLTFQSSITLRKLDDLSNTTLTLTNVSSGVYSDYTAYSIYNSDFVKMWRYLGWEDHHQRWVTRHQLCGTLDTSAPVFQNINGFLRQFNGLLSYESGLYVLKIETTSDTIASNKTAESGYTIGVEKNVRYITNDDIIGSIKVTDPGPKKAYNTMTSTIADPGSRFKGKQVSFYDSNFLKTDKNVIKSGSHTQAACHSYYNARINVENALRKSRFGMKISFQLGPKALLLLAGETIAITYDKFGWSGKKFRISNITFNTDCTANITANEYDDSFYTISTPILASLTNDDIRGPVRAVLGTPNGLAANAVTMGNIDLTWINGSNVAPANKTEIWVASSNDRTKADFLNEVSCISSIQQRVNGAVNGTAVTLDSGNGVLVGQLVTGPGISATDVTVATISGTALTLSSSQTIADNVYLTFDNTASFQHGIGEDAQAKYYWIRHRRLNSKNKPTYSAWHPTSATAGVTATSTIPEIFYSVTVSSDAQIFNANSSSVIQDPDYVKFTATKNALSGAFVWSTSPSVNLYAATSGGSPTTSGTSIYLRKADFSSTSVSVTATVTSTSAERTAGADNTYFETVTIPRVDAGTDATGADAKLVRIRASSLTFKEDIDNAVTPAYIKLDAVKQNTSATANWAVTDDSPSVDLYAATTGGSAVTTGDTIYLRKADFSTNTAVTVTLTCDSIVDTTNIIRLEESSGTIQAVLSNPAHVLPADSDGAVSNTQAVGSGTNIRVYEGTTALTFVTGTPSTGEWALSVGNTADITEGGVTDQGTYATIGNHTGVTTGTDTYTITYTISGKTRKAESFTSFTVDQYLTKAKAGTAGAPGAAGDDAKAVHLTVDDYSIIYNAAGSSPSPSGNMTLTATSQNFTNGYFKFTGDGISDEGSYTDGSGANADTFTFAIPSSHFSAPKSLRVGVAESDAATTEIAFDTITINAVKPGTEGDDAHTGFLTNSAHVVSTATDGTGYSYTGAGGTFERYDGGTDKTGSDTTYYVGASGTNVTETKNGLTMTITQSSGVYALSGGSWTSDSETFTMRAIYDSVTVTNVYTISKSKKGTTGVTGRKAAELTIYYPLTFSASLTSFVAPTTPSTGTYDFSNSTIASLPTQNSITWTQTKPAAATAVFIYKSEALVTESSTDNTSNAITWATPSIEGYPFNDVNWAFRRAAAATDVDDLGTSAYPALTAVGGTWYDDLGDVPAGSNPVWVTKGTTNYVLSSGTYTYITTWQDATQLEGSTGATGDEGKGTTTIYLLVTGFTQPSTPSSGTDETPGSWITTLPTAATGKVIWFSLGTKPAGSSTWTFTTPQLYMGDLDYGFPQLINDEFDFNFDSIPQYKNNQIQLSAAGVLSGAGTSVQVNLNSIPDAGNTKTYAGYAGTGLDSSGRAKVGIISGGVAVTVADMKDAKIRAFTGLTSSGILDTTVPEGKGGTGLTSAGNAIVNSRIKPNADGTLSYDNTTTGAMTMNTIADANNIRSRITTGLTSAGLVDEAVPTGKGGTGTTTTTDFLNSDLGVSLTEGTLSLTRTGTNSTASVPSTLKNATIAIDGTTGVISGIGTADIKVNNAKTTFTELQGTKPPADANKVVVAAGTDGRISVDVNGAGASNIDVYSSAEKTKINRLQAGQDPDDASRSIQNNDVTVASDGVLTGIGTSSVKVNNSKITTNTNGTLNYDGATGGTPSLASITGVVSKSGGGFGTSMASSTGIVRFASGTLNTDTALSTTYTDATDNGTTINTSGNISGTVDVASGGSITVGQITIDGTQNYILISD